MGVWVAMDGEWKLNEHVWCDEIWWKVGRKSNTASAGDGEDHFLELLEQAQEQSPAQAQLPPNGNPIGRLR